MEAGERGGTPTSTARHLHHRRHHHHHCCCRRHQHLRCSYYRCRKHLCSNSMAKGSIWWKSTPLTWPLLAGCDLGTNACGPPPLPPLLSKLPLPPPPPLTSLTPILPLPPPPPPLQSLPTGATAHVADAETPAGDVGVGVGCALPKRTRGVIRGVLRSASPWPRTKGRKAEPLQFGPVTL